MEPQDTYFDESIDFPNDESVQEQFYEDFVIEKLQKMFPNKIFHMKTLLTLYSFCFPKKSAKKPVFEKTIEEVVNEIHSTTISLDLGSILKEQTDAIKDFHDENAKIGKRIAAIPMFIDFAYLYYVWCYDKEAPIHKLPMTILKFNLISDALQAPNDDLNAYFAQCIENYFIRDVRIEQPPFMVRTDLSHDEIKEKINMIVKPVCKEILNGLFALDKSRRKVITDKTVPEIANQREDNLFIESTPLPLIQTTKNTTPEIHSTCRNIVETVENPLSGKMP